jgi:hypothetical protein
MTRFVFATKRQAKTGQEEFCWEARDTPKKPFTTQTVAISCALYFDS